MSNFNGHYKGGLAGATLVVAGGIASGMQEPIHLAAMGLSTLAFALFPDVDIKSTPSKIFYGLFLVYLTVLYYLQEFKLATVSSMIAMLPQVTKHRGVFHSVAAAIIIPSYPLYFAQTGSIGFDQASALWLCGSLGYFIHLALDKKFKLL